MAPALRLFRILATTVVCIVLFAALTEFTLGLRYHMPSKPVDPLDYFRWGIAFRATSYVFFGAVPIAAVLFALDRFRVRAWWPFFLPWVGAGFLTNGVLGLIFVGPIIGGIYWLLTGRVSKGTDPVSMLLNTEPLAASAVSKPALPIDEGMIKGPDLRWSPPRNYAWRALNFAGYAAVAYFFFIIAGGIYDGTRLAWVSVHEPSKGTPEFTTRSEHEMTTQMKVAMSDFPNPESCLKKEAISEAGSDLMRMDWDRIDNTEEAQVCMFRLLASLGGMDKSEAWLKAQGFRLSQNSFNIRNPYEESDGTLRVTAGWSIREDGPKFPTHGLIRRLIASIPYAMSIDTGWSADRSKLLYVALVMNIL